MIKRSAHIVSLQINNGYFSRIGIAATVLKTEGLEKGVGVRVSQYPPNIMIKTTEYKFNIEKVAASSLVPEYILLTGEIDIIKHEIINDLVVRLSAYVACSDEKEFNEVIPLNAWEHLKKDYAPKWFKRKYPVKYQTIKFAAKEVFPEYTPLTKDKRHLHVRISKLDSLAKCKL